MFYTGIRSIREWHHSTSAHTRTNCSDLCGCPEPLALRQLPPCHGLRDEALGGRGHPSGGGVTVAVRHAVAWLPGTSL